jgi:hypothetical protein
MENKNGLKPVRVTVPVTRDVDFIVYVKDTENMDEIVAALKEKDPSEWETDPCFYEHFGDVWKRVEDLITRENVKVVDGV